MDFLNNIDKNNNEIYYFCVKQVRKMSKNEMFYEKIEKGDLGWILYRNGY